MRLRNNTLSGADGKRWSTHNIDIFMKKTDRLTEVDVPSPSSIF
jgi:hypothetical protein